MNSARRREEFQRKWEKRLRVFSPSGSARERVMEPNVGER
jgi:hypothetical protein